MIRRTVAALVAVPFIYIIVAAIGALWPLDPDDDVAEGPHTVLLVAGPIHYDILVPLDPITHEAFAFVGAAGIPVSHPDAQWLAIGWGSRAFYTRVGDYTDVSVSAAWTAATGDASVLRVSVLPALNPHPKIRSIGLSRQQYDALIMELRSEFGEAPLPYAIDGLGLGGVFFPSARPFDIFRTCNTWVAMMLSGAGLKMGRWTPTPFAVTLSLWWFGHLEADAMGQSG